MKKKNYILLFYFCVCLIFFSCSGKKKDIINYTDGKNNTAFTDETGGNAVERQNQIDKFLQNENELLKKYKENPKDGKTILELARYYFSIKKYDLMLAYIEKLKSEDRSLYRKAETGFITDSYNALHLNTTVFVKEKNYDRALNEYMKLINLFPERTELYYEIVDLYIKTDKSHTALLYISDIYRRLPEDPYINAALGDLYYLTENKEMSKNYYERAVGVERMYYEPVARLAQIHADAGNFPKAENLLLKTFEFNRDKIDLIYKIAKFYASFHKYDKSNVFYKKMIESFDSDILLLIEASENAILANDNEYAVKLCEKILAIDKANISAWSLLSLAYTNKGDFIAAYRCSEEIKKLRKY